MNNRFLFLYILRIILGLLFILSAIAKLIYIDQFEIYLYSFGLISLNASFLTARLCIGGELLLGIGIASNLYGRFVNCMTYITLFLFCVFLCYNIIIGRNDSCQCFGALIEIKPTQSLLKNIALIVLTWVTSKIPSFKWTPNWYLWICLIATCLSIPFIISKPDHWRYNDRDKEIPYNTELFSNEIVKDSVFINRGILSGNKIISFISPYCHYCQMAVEKMQTIQKRYNIPDSLFIYTIPQPPEEINVNYNPLIINRRLFSDITYGQRPIIVFVSNGVPIQSVHYRAIEEHEIKEFLMASATHLTEQDKP